MHIGGRAAESERVAGFNRNCVGFGDLQRCRPRSRFALPLMYELSTRFG